MRVYFLMEGARTEINLYPAWLRHILPNFIQSKQADDVNAGDTYYLISGNGYPSILKFIDKSAEDLLSLSSNNCKYDYFVVVVDGEDVGYTDRKKEILNRCYSITFPEHIKIRVIVQNPCIETWLLGNRQIFPDDTTDQKMLEYKQFYNIKIDDPEMMGKPTNYMHSIAKFHETFLRRCIVSLTSNKKTYKKKNLGPTTEKNYFDEIVSRQKDTNHIKSFLDFTEFCDEITANQ